MSTMRRTLLVFFVVALLVGALAMPAVVSAGPKVEQMLGEATALYVPGEDFYLSVGPVVLFIPSENIIDARPGEVTMAVTLVEERDEGRAIVVEVKSKLRRKDFDGPAYLAFGEPITAAYDGCNPNPHKALDVYGYWVEVHHFSRYSGWF